MNVVSFSFDLASKKWSVGGLPSNLDSERTLVLLFGPPTMLDDRAALSELVQAFPRSQILGCSSPGAVEGGATRDGALVVTVVQFEKTTMSSAQTSVGATTDAFAAGQSLAKKLSKPSLRALLVLADGVEVNGAELVRGLNSALDQSVVVVGGLAADDRAWKRAWVLSGSNVKTGLVAAVGLYGEHVVVAPTTRSGWTPVGPELVVTKSDGSVIYELDGKPALTVFEERLAQSKGSAAGSLAVPLAVRATVRHDKSLVRSVIAVDAAKKSIKLAAEIPQGYLVQPLTASVESLVAAAREAQSSDASPSVGSDAVVLAISHAGRRAVLGAHTADELGAALAAVPPGPKAHMIGFFGYGEIAPFGTGHSELHNQSLTLAMLMESPTPLPRKASRGLAAGAVRAQAPATSAGPAAHLRSRHQTVDDLFLELEVEGGKGGVRAPGRPGAPPVPRKPPTPAPLAKNGNGNGAHADAEDSTYPSLPGPGALPSVEGSGVPAGAPVERVRSRMKTPLVVDVDAAALSKPGKGLSLTSFTHDSEAGKWSVGALPAIDSPSTLVFAFGLPALGGATGPLEELVKAYPTSRIIGCASTRLVRGAGRATGDLFVSAARFAHTELETAWADLALGSVAAGEKLADALSRPDLRAVFVLADASTDGDAFLRALSASLRPGVVVSGGVVATGGGRSWVACGKTIRTGIVAAVGFYGNHLSVQSEASSSFDAFGPERRVTRSSGHIVYEIDGKPALSVYAEYVGGVVSALTPGAMPFPLSVRDSNDVLRVRMPVAFDTGAQSVSFAGDVPQDSWIRLMRANPDRLVDDVLRAANTAKAGIVSGSAAFVLAVSSIGRAQALGARADEETEAILEAIPGGVAHDLAGFYSLAEFGSGVAGLGNESITLTVFSESETPVLRVEPVFERRTIPVPSNPAQTPSPSQSTRPSSQPRRRQEVIRSVMSGGAAPSGAAVSAKVTTEKKGELLLVSFNGRLSENFKGDSIGRELNGTVVFDLGGVERITSFGVREWLNMLSASQDRVKKLYFAHCSEAVVNQLSMIRKFAGNAQVVSFFTPYLCDSCGEQFERLIDCELDADAVRSNSPPESVCRRCSGKGRFDDDPETYFAFAPAHVGQTVPKNVRALLDVIDTMKPAATADAIDKTIDGDITRVRVSTKLAANVRWQRVLDGIEGALVIDLGGVGAIDEKGIINFENALGSLSSDVTTVRLDRAPQGVVEHFARSGLPRRVVIASTVVTGFCSSCGVQRPALLVVDDHAHSLAASKEPALNCKRCNGRLDLVDATELLSFLSRQRKRTSMAPRGSLPSVAPPSGMPSLPPAAPLPTAVSAPPTPAPGGARGVIGGAAILSVAILASAGFFTYARSHATPAVEAPVSPVATQAPSPLTDLPPPWVERPFVEENGVLLVVGRCDRAPTSEAALAQARNEAVARIVKQAYGDLTGTPIYDFLVVRVKEEEAKKRSAAVAERYLRQVGSVGTPDRGETVVRQRTGGVEAFARYRLSRAAYTQVLALYKATAQFQGMTVARAFPLLEAGPADGDLVVVGVGKGRAAEVAGFKIGDFILGMNNKPVPSLDAFSKAGDDWAGLAVGGTYEVVVESAGAKQTLKLKKSYASVPAQAGPPAPVQPAPSSQQPKPRDMGIILPPRTF